MMGLGSLGSLLASTGENVRDSVGEVIDPFYDPQHPYDTLALSPLIGMPFGYHQFRQGRSSKVTSLASLFVSIATTEAAFYFAGRSAGFSSAEWAMGRGLTAIGVRYGGRGFTYGALFGVRHGATARLGWTIPGWFYAVVAYEAWHRGWFEGSLSGLPFEHWSPQIY